MEVETLQKQALAVEMPDENFDPSIEPTNGEEYLKKVIYERSNCPSIVVKPIENKYPPTVATGMDQYISVDIIDSSQQELRPTPEWKQYQLRDFVKLRNQVVKFRQKLSENGFTPNDLIPLTDDDDAWKRFCQQTQPLLSTVLRIDQRSLELLLEFESNWLRERRDDEAYIELGGGKDKWLGSWIYSTLASLHLPLEPSVFSVLRDIAKSCVVLRNKLTKDQEDDANPLNLFIFLISKYFNQLDLMEFV